MATEYLLQANYGYGHGWEDVVTEDSREEIDQRHAKYRENMPQYPYRVVKREENDSE